MSESRAREGQAAGRSGPPRWLVIGFAVVAIAAVAFALGRFTAFGSSDTAAPPASDSAEAGFARDMQVHHAQAVDMAMTIYRSTQNDDVRMLAYDIATTQSGQRGEFADWLIQWGLSPTGKPLMSWMAGTDAHAAHGGATEAELTEAELREHMGMATDAELARLAGATGTPADCLFLELMIEHHEGALPMAQALIELGSNPRALQVARGVKQTQSSEIDAMQSLQRTLSCS